MLIPDGLSDGWFAQTINIMSSNYKVLKLNRSYFPLAVCSWEKVAVDIFSGAVLPARCTTEDGKLSDFVVCPTLNEWKALDPREGEKFIQTPHAAFVIPRIVICTSYDRVPFRRALFPTKKNIWERDDYTCGYTGKKLTQRQLSIDHIIPSSKGGKITWENLITCDRNLNSDKSDMSVEEAGLKLQWAPKKPTNGLVFDILDTAWESFIS